MRSSPSSTDGIQMKIGNWSPLEPAVIAAMIDMGGNFSGVKSHLDLGSGDGRVIGAALAIGLASAGIEIEAALANPCIARGLDVTLGDLFDLPLGGYDLYTAWFSDSVGTPLLLDKIYSEMKKNKYLVLLYDSFKSHRNLPGEGIPIHAWRPEVSGSVLGNTYHLYKR